MSENTKKWIAVVHEDPDNSEECYLQFPEDMIAELGWTEGDTIIWDVNEADGTVIIRKVDK